MMKYAGIGSRKVPVMVSLRMAEIAKRLTMSGWKCRTGGADGADNAFKVGVEEINPSALELYLPWRKFNGIRYGYYPPSSEAESLAARYHPAWETLSPPARLLMARNMHQVLGYGLDDPVKFIVCWTSDGKASGGTGQALRLAADYPAIKVFNLYNESIKDEEIHEFAYSLQVV